MRSANSLSLVSDFAATSLLDSISSMSLLAASVTKSWVDGLMPSVELTPVFSGTDWAATDVARSVAIAAAARNLCISGLPCPGRAADGNAPTRAWPETLLPHEREGPARASAGYGWRALLQEAGTVRFLKVTEKRSSPTGGILCS